MSHDEEQNTNYIHRAEFKQPTTEFIEQVSGKKKTLLS